MSDGGYELTFFQLQVKEHPTPTCWVDSGVGMLSPGASFSLRPSASLPVYWDHCQTGWPLQRQDNATAVVVNCTSTSFQIQVQRKKASVCLLADPVSLLFSVSQWVWCPPLMTTGMYWFCWSDLSTYSLWEPVYSMSIWVQCTPWNNNWHLVTKRTNRCYWPKPPNILRRRMGPKRQHWTVTLLPATLPCPGGHGSSFQVQHGPPRFVAQPQDQCEQILTKPQTRRWLAWPSRLQVIRTRSPSLSPNGCRIVYLCWGKTAARAINHCPAGRLRWNVCLNNEISWRTENIGWIVLSFSGLVSQAGAWGLQEGLKIIPHPHSPSLPPPISVLKNEATA